MSLNAVLIYYSCYHILFYVINYFFHKTKSFLGFDVSFNIPDIKDGTTDQTTQTFGSTMIFSSTTNITLWYSGLKYIIDSYLFDYNDEIPLLKCYYRKDSNDITSTTENTDIKTIKEELTYEYIEKNIRDIITWKDSTKS